MTFKKYRGAGACIVNAAGTHVLLVQQKQRRNWSFPKGHKLPEESFFNCMKREVFEETGLRFTSSRHVVHEEIRRKPYFIYVLVDFGESKLQQRLRPRDTREILCARWVPLNACDQLPMNKVTRDITSKMIKQVTI